MKLAVDVHYRGSRAAVAGVTFASWAASQPAGIYRSYIEGVAPYEPGKFFGRELPCIVALLNEYKLSPDVVVIDGYVYLDGREKPGLGKHVFDALKGRAKVIGVAKTAFAGIGAEFEVLRGRSAKPLYVTCAGMELEDAKQSIRQMHGAHRMPMLLKLADQTCRAMK